MYAPPLDTAKKSTAQLPPSKERVLVVEDERDIARLVQMHLTELGCACDIVHDGERALHLALERRYDLLILDLMLPGLNGLEICRELRTEKNYTPILMLTSRSEEFDRVLGLEYGADDYLAKPFSIRELLARVKAIFRRVAAVRDDATGAGRRQFRSGDLFVDLERRSLTVGGATVDLTPKEFDLLALFVGSPGKVFTRQGLLDTVWGYSYDGFDHTVNSHINRLRAKIEQDPGDPKYILTVWGVGYRFTEES